MYASEKPAPTSTSSSARRKRCSGVEVAGDRAAQGHRRRHAVEHDPRDLLDDVDLARDVARPMRRDRHLPCVVDVEVEPLEDRPLLLGWDVEADAATLAARAAASRRAVRAGRRLTSAEPVSSAPARSTRSRLASTAAGSAAYGSTPFSHLFDPSVRSASRSDVWRMPIGSKFAASSSSSVVCLGDLGLEAAHDRRQRDRPLAVGDQEVARQKLPLRAVERAERSPRARRRTTIRPPASFARSKAWSGLPQTCMT